jgi:hypothetical protein
LLASGVITPLVAVSVYPDPARSIARSTNSAFLPALPRRTRVRVPESTAPAAPVPGVITTEWCPWRREQQSRRCLQSYFRLPPNGRGYSFRRMHGEFQLDGGMFYRERCAFRCFQVPLVAVSVYSRMDVYICKSENRARLTTIGTVCPGKGCGSLYGFCSNLSVTSLS